ncbi:MAG TPA: translation elongation factor 4 [Candidatus Nanoarchaeia archaeon]
MKNIRNFSIIAHIDHGKSTLADRLLEITSTVTKEKMTPQYLDQLELERERGITIKLAPVTMRYKIQDPKSEFQNGSTHSLSRVSSRDKSQNQNPHDKNKFELRTLDFEIEDLGFILNLIDTPGHVDFSYEVSRSLAAVEGAILLVDATKGVEAQTLSNFILAKDQNLKIIPAINKIDLPNIQIEEVEKQLINSLGFGKDEIFRVSAKTGQGVRELLAGLIERIPGPVRDEKKPLRALVFDSFYDQFKGVVAYVRVFDGKVKEAAKIKFLGTGQESEVVSVGYFSPELKEKDSLTAGEIGWIATGLKEVSKVRVGDTLSLSGEEVEPLTGYKESKPMVFAGLFPVERSDFKLLKDSLEKLKLNDASLSYEMDSSPALGFGVRAGFLGMLHMEIVQERLEREFGLELIISSPTVRYKIGKTSGEELVVSNPSKLPKQTEIKEIMEPWVKGSIISTKDFTGSVLELVNSRKAKVNNIEYFGEKSKISCELPLSEIVSDFYDKLKTVSSGFASFDYELADFRPIDAVKLEILVAKEPVDALSQIIPKEKAFRVGKALVQKLKEAIPRQQFEVSLQAAINGKIIAAERIPAFRKDVTAKLYGGDRTRKDKLLQKQKKGKKRMKRVGKVDIPQEAFLSVLKI